MEGNDLISVVVAVYNAEEYLDQNIESILGQTYKNIEILLIDDGSKDHSLSKCLSYKDKDARIHVFHKENGGLTSARKFGYENAQGKFIVFFDSDDIVEPNYIEKQYVSITANDADLSICSYFSTNGNGKSPAPYLHAKSIYNQEDFVDDLIMPSVWADQEDQTCIPNFLWLRMFKKELITASCFFSEREVYTEDMLFNMEYLKQCKRISVIDDPLYVYCTHANTLTHQYRQNRLTMETNRVRQMEKELGFYGINGSQKLNLSYFRGICGCINNAFYLGAYKLFRKEVSITLGQREVQTTIWKIAYKNLSILEKLRLFACRYRLYFLLYLFEKILRSC